MVASKNKLKDTGKIKMATVKKKFRYSMSIGRINFTLLVLGLLLAGCSGAPDTVRSAAVHSATSSGAIKDVDPEKISALQKDLAVLNREASMLEARQVAETAVIYSGQLAEEYDLVRPAVLHNVFVRVGLKNRGLCYHWTEDLIKRLQSLDLKTYQLHWGVAYRGSELREHNSVVITARGDAFNQGMVLDPWRNSGNLYWALIKTDSYPWQELPPNEW